MQTGSDNRRDTDLIKRIELERRWRELYIHSLLNEIRYLRKDLERYEKRPKITYIKN